MSLYFTVHSGIRIAVSTHYLTKHRTLALELMTSRRLSTVCSQTVAQRKEQLFNEKILLAQLMRGLAQLGMYKLVNKHVLHSFALPDLLDIPPRQVAAITIGHATFDTCMSQPLSDDN
jgi:hypothetical protein